MNSETFQAGCCYLITTEKVTVLQPDSPWRELMKRSTYAVTTLAESPAEMASWMASTALPHIGVHARKGSKYLLCTLAKDAGVRGSSEFIDMETGTIYAKKEIAKYLPDNGEFGAYISIGVDSIREAVPLNPTQPAQPRIDKDEAESLYVAMDQTCRELILDAVTNRARENTVMELIGCDFLVAGEIVQKHFKLETNQPF